MRAGAQRSGQNAPNNQVFSASWKALLGSVLNAAPVALSLTEAGGIRLASAVAYLPLMGRLETVLPSVAVTLIWKVPESAP